MEYRVGLPSEVTIPLLKPVILLYCSLELWTVLNNLIAIYAATKGNNKCTMTISVQAFYHSFRWTNMVMPTLVLLWAFVCVSYFLVGQWRKAVSEVVDNLAIWEG